MFKISENIRRLSDKEKLPPPSVAMVNSGALSPTSSGIIDSFNFKESFPCFRNYLQLPGRSMQK